MFDETTAASIVSALRRWTGSSSAKDVPLEDEPFVSFHSVVQTGLTWSEGLRGLMERGLVELNPLIENLSETLGGARVVFEPVVEEGAGRVRPSLDVRRFASESRARLGAGHDLSTPLNALRPDMGPVQTVLKLTDKTLFDGCTVPVRSWAGDRQYGLLHVEWPRRPRISLEEIRWRLLTVAQLIADACAADERERKEKGAMSHLLEELKASHDACLIVDGDSIVFANESAARLFETTERRLKNVNLSQVLQRSGRSESGAVAPTDGARQARRLVLGDGAVRLVEATERPLEPERRDLRLVRIFEPDSARRARHRAMLESLSEAVWQVDLRVPLPADKVSAQSLRAALEQSTLAQWNGHMADLIRDVSPASGEAPEIGDVLAFLGDALLKEFVKGGLRLRNREHKMRGRDGSWRHFVVNLQGVRRDGHLTHMLGSTLETTAYAEVEQQTVSSLEKQREDLGRELHDVVGQLLTGIRLLSSNLARDTSLPPEKIRLHATRVSQMAEEAHLNLRQINRGLSAAHLQHVRLDDALHDLAEFVGSMPSVECTFDCEEAVDELDPEKKLQIYRIAQESVNNALKHSSATQITLQWRRNGSGFMLVVSDNGVGFDEQELNRKTLGLHSMRYRARVVGAELQIHSTQGRGTSVQCLLPG